MKFKLLAGNRVKLGIQCKSMTHTNIYSLTDPRTSEVRYVGKSDNPNRRLSAHLNDKTNSRRSQWLAELGAVKMRPIVAVLEVVLVGSWEERERFWIAEMKRIGHRLTNTTRGGNGVGLVLQRTREAQSAALMGRCVSKATRLSIGKANKGKKPSAATQEARAAARNGVPLTESHRQAISAGLIGRPVSNKTRRAISAALKGLKNQEARYRALGDSNKQYWARYRAARSEGHNQETAYQIAKEKGAQS